MHSDMRRLFEPKILDFEEDLDSWLQAREAPIAADRLYGMIRYHLGFATSTLGPLSPHEKIRRGKRMRAIITAAVADCVGAAAEPTRTLMMAAEIMHSASLVHDDIQDEDPLRWNRETVWKLFGVPHAINVGDAMVALTYRTLLDLRKFGIPERNVIEIIESFNDGHRKMTEGQYLDIEFSGWAKVSLDRYIDIVRLKTAAACECVCRAAALLGSADPEIVEGYTRYACELGIFYQICDDIASVWSTTSQAGKRAMQDVLLGKASLPLIYARALGGPACQALCDAVASYGDAPIPEPLRLELCEYFERHNIHQACLDHADKHFYAARAILIHLQRDRPSEGGKALESILYLCRAMVFPASDSATEQSIYA